MKALKVLAAVLGLSLLGGGMAISAEPPVVTAEDISGIDVSQFIQYPSVIEDGLSFGRSVGFTSRVNDEGHMFVYRFFGTRVQSVRLLGADRTEVSLRQIDCQAARSRDLSVRVAFDSGSTEETQPMKWRYFGKNSAEDQTCTQAYSDRALAAR